MPREPSLVKKCELRWRKHVGKTQPEFNDNESICGGFAVLCLSREGGGGGGGGRNSTDVAEKERCREWMGKKFEHWVDHRRVGGVADKAGRWWGSSTCPTSGIRNLSLLSSALATS
jgi:hypothetical protein